MNHNLTLKNTLVFTAIVTLLICASLAWDYFHDGVPTHYLLHSKDLPGFSNWWGIVLIPAVTLYLLQRIRKRLTNNRTENLKQVIYRFLAALGFGIVLSILFLLGSDLPGIMMIGVIILSFFIRLYLPEYILGNILGLVYTFGGVLPVIISLVLLSIFVITYSGIRKGILLIVARFR